MEIPIMIIKDKLKQNVINLLIFSLFHLKKMTMDPRIVERPATEEIIKGMKKDIKSPIKFYAVDL